MAYTTIKDPSAYFQTKLYTGGTAEAKTFDGNSNLKPDWFWSKKRGASESHQTADSVRGIANSLRTDSTIAEYTNSETDDLASFDTNGFTFNGTGDTYNGTTTSSDYVAWCWSAGGGTGVANTDGDIASTVSANTTSGFSIVSYTGTGSASTIGHGLNSAPKVIIIKDRSNARNWQSYHESLGNQAYLRLNTTGAASTGAAIWNNTSPTSLVFSIGTSAFDAVNASGDDYIAYCFAEKQGFSKFGSYIGNGSTDGTFVYTGFKPAFVMTKAYSGTTSDAAWSIVDTKRANSYNPQQRLFPNASDAESGTGVFDLLSNGFKLVSNASTNNASSTNYIYMAFAEQPLVGDNPATAR